MGEVVPPPEILSASEVQRFADGIAMVEPRSYTLKLAASHEALRERVQAAERQRDLAREQVVEIDTACHRAFAEWKRDLDAAEARVRALEDALAKPVGWMHPLGGAFIAAKYVQPDGWVPVYAVLASGEPTATEQCPTCGSPWRGDSSWTEFTCPDAWHSSVPFTEREEE